MLDRLRSLTRPAHERLESELALLSEPLNVSRIQHVLMRFHGFHRAWEPRVAQLTGETEFFAPRRRLGLLEADIAALGGRALSSATPDLGFMTDRSAAWGSAYVMEGSTLGGQVISKALRGAPWAPAAGLGYFNPYGRRTAAMWEEFRLRLTEANRPDDMNAIAAGAVATFEALRLWASPLCREAA